MATEEQIAANRRNAQLSTGPKTEAGKYASSLNALRHGITGQIDVATPDEKEARDKFCDEIVASLAPTPGLEHQLAHSIAEDHWRLNRVRSIENNVFTSYTFAGEDSADLSDLDKALGTARAFITEPRRFLLLTVYEQRIHRNMSKSLQQLTAIQTTRRAAEATQAAALNAQREQALEEARLHVQLAETEGLQCDPAVDFPDKNGFVFSNAEIAREIRRVMHLQTAKGAESSHRGRPVRHAA
jgi:hypothetical protein